MLYIELILIILSSKRLNCDPNTIANFSVVHLVDKQITHPALQMKMQPL